MDIECILRRGTTEGGACGRVSPPPLENLFATFSENRRLYPSNFLRFWKKINTLLPFLPFWKIPPLLFSPLRVPTVYTSENDTSFHRFASYYF